MIGIGELLPRVDEASLARHAEQLRREGYCRIDSILSDDAADALAAELRDELPWQVTLRQGDRIWEAPPALEAAIGLDKLRAMAAEGAADKFRFLYDVVRVLGTDAERDRRGLLIDRLARAWTSPQALAIWARLTGNNGIKDVVAKATRFRPGHFLTIHDDGKYEHQVAAFTLALSKDWRPEWGGQLQIVEDGEVAAVLTPRFNSLSVMLVPRLHFVSMVAPFAPQDRLTLTGWFTTRAQPSPPS